jgi:hypothetical protein
MDEVIGRRIDNVTIAMVETLLKEYKAIEDKYDKLKNDSLTKARHTLLKTLLTIPSEQRTAAESEMFLRLINSNISEIGTKEDKDAELDTVAIKIVQLISDAVKGKFIMPLDRHNEYLYVKEVTLHGTVPNYTVWLSGVMLRTSGVINQDGVVVSNLHNKHQQLTLIQIVDMETIQKDFKDYCKKIMSNVDLFKVMCANPME